MVNWQQLLTSSYWFSQPAGAEGWTYWGFLLFFLAFFVAGIVLRVVMRFKNDAPTRTALARFSSLGLTLGFFGLLWLFFRQQRVSFLAWRFWLPIWDIIFIWWLYRIVHYLLRRAPQLREEQRERQRIEKYLPKNK
ncbi:MAG TPA: hypothetical protein VJA27_01075 [Patescibacteria group bacterium]|nr:hypothetical protein [Patescibacteria group bacterium]